MAAAAVKSRGECRDSILNVSRIANKFFSTVPSILSALVYCSQQYFISIKSILNGISNKNGQKEVDKKKMENDGSTTNNSQYT